MAKRVLSVLVVDDSAVVRQAATAILSQDPASSSRWLPIPISLWTKWAVHGPT